MSLTHYARGPKEHDSSTDRDEKSKVISAQVFVDDGEGGDDYLGTAHALADRNYKMKKKRAKEYTSSTEA